MTLSAGRRLYLDGFFRAASGDPGTLLVFVHGMGSNFYRSRLKKAFFDAAPPAGLAVFSFNNRGAGSDTEDEVFSDCLADIDAAMAFGHRSGFRRFVLVGHSTGCQKIVHYQARRRRRDVAGLVLLAPADDFAICRRDLGRRFAATVGRARALVRAGRGTERIRGLHEAFSARRFLSIADRSRPEAAVFDYDGAMKGYQSLRLPVLAVFGTREEFAILPVRTMLDRLAAAHPPGRVTGLAVPGANHGFHGREAKTAAAVVAWAASLRPAAR